MGTNSTSLLIKEIGCPLLNIAHSQDAGQHTARHWAPIYLDATANFAYPASPQATGINGEAFNIGTLATNAYIAEPVRGKHRHQQQQASMLLSLYQHNKHLTTRLATIARAWTHQQVQFCTTLRKHVAHNKSKSKAWLFADQLGQLKHFPCPWCT